jgi:1-acyl-sn-glycerol-3-phosphate acyltransferase
MMLQWPLKFWRIGGFEIMSDSQTIYTRTPVLFPRWLGQLWLNIFGWKLIGQAPDLPKYILIAAPHTSNWDLPFMLAAAAILRVRISWMGKNTLFKWPFGGVMRWLGGIPIDRSRPSGVVLQIVRMLKKSERLILAVPPSGTRKKRDYWKSGFYWIAHTAKVPIVCAYLDYGKKEAGLGLTFIPSGDVRADMDRIRTFYQDIQGKHPELVSTMRLREEDEPSGRPQADAAGEMD